MNALSVNDVVLTTAILLVIGVGMVSSLLLVPGKREAARDTFQAMLSMLIVAGTILMMFWGGALTLVPFLLILAFRTGYEATHVRLGAPAAVKVGVGAAVAAAMAMLSPILTIGLAGLWLLIFSRRVFVPNPSTGRLHALAEVALFPVIPMAILAFSALNPDLRPLVLIIYVLVELFDSCAYAVGKFLGRTPAFPVLSPRKTVEGLIGGALCLMVVVAGVTFWANLPVWPAILLTAAACGFGVAGDLGGSRLKRAGGVKDFPAVLKKQGGALDIFDSWIAAGAAISLLITLQNLL
ncbi:phosphatidate cytidylyltransferase [Shimia gijangensis]|uniref:Phosphatidate cytidylyltransferase n=1 Tax=Shimia gijangensis TaxID=1470563 RepID=A0A1M6JSV8_9RHOB|nr:phosphatidate cytidylyltransferase [Shimia gijangensis]SHJ49736.1 phosphatidate cytidylyltransferase [Shimia gijangensis]